MRRLSVLIPSYNAAPYLAASIDSILCQVAGDDEVVVVDDGSTDDTPAVLARYAGRVRVVQGPHAGLAAARNTALEAAAGDWIAFHDADDLAAPDRLSVLRGVLDAHPDADGVFSTGRRLGAPDRPLSPVPLAERLDAARLRPVHVFLGFPVYFQTSLVSRRTFERVGPFDEALEVQPDLEYGYRLFGAAHVRFVNRPTFTWRSHADNMSRNHVGTREDVAVTLERVLGADGSIAREIGRRRLTGRLARNWYRLARTYEKRGEVGRAAHAARRAAELRPLHPRYRYLRWQLA
jgi:glycosyltransferase involved in cell wall biosynthesis